jgi:hypothetical protein
VTSDGIVEPADAEPHFRFHKSPAFVVVAAIGPVTPISLRRHRRACAGRVPRNN